jgi:hypothetical protein
LHTPGDTFGAFQILGRIFNLTAASLSLIGAGDSTYPIARWFDRSFIGEPRLFGRFLQAMSQLW